MSELEDWKEIVPIECAKIEHLELFAQENTRLFTNYINSRHRYLARPTGPTVSVKQIEKNLTEDSMASDVAYALAEYKLFSLGMSISDAKELLDTDIDVDEFLSIPGDEIIIKDSIQNLHFLLGFAAQNMRIFEQYVHRINQETGDAPMSHARIKETVDEEQLMVLVILAIEYLAGHGYTVDKAKLLIGF